MIVSHAVPNRVGTPQLAVFIGVTTIFCLCPTNFAKKVLCVTLWHMGRKLNKHLCYGVPRFLLAAILGGTTGAEFDPLFKFSNSSINVSESQI